jgi:hypothetical protein
VVAGRWVAHLRPSDAMFGSLAILAFASLLFLGRTLTFFGDEWEFLTSRQALTLTNLLGPHNEHWSLFPVLAYDVLFSIVGLHSYLPYLAILLAVHVTAVAGLFVLLRRAAGPVVALGGATLMLFLGSAYEDLFWAFQIGFVSSVAAGLWAIVIIETSTDRHALIAVGALLFIAVASSGLGLFFLVAIATVGLFDPDRRRTLRPVALVSVVYVVWFLAFGRAGLSTSDTPFSLTALEGIPSGVLAGGGRGIGGLLGVDIQADQALFVVLVAAVAWGLIRGQRVPYLAIAAVAGLISQFALIALAREPLYGSGSVAASAPRYVYSSAAFILLALAAFLGERAKESVSWRQVTAVALVVAFSLVGNLSMLRGGARVFTARASDLRAAVAWIEAHPDSPLVRADVAPTRYTPVGVSDIVALGRRRGSITRDGLVPGLIRSPSAAESDQAVVRMAEAEFTIRAAQTPVVAGSPPLMTAAHDIATTPRGGCLSLRVTGSAPRLSIIAPGGQPVLFESDASGTVKALLGLRAAPVDPDAVSAALTGGQEYLIGIPDIGAEAWTLAIVPPADALGGLLCSLGSTGP